MASGSSTLDIDFAALARRIKAWGAELGFARIGIAGIDLRDDEAHLQEWLRQGRHGSMEYMQRHGRKRSRPDELQPGTVRVISARMDYSPTGADSDAAWQTLRDGERAYIARYALGRDYHKLIRGRLQKLADRIETETGPFGYRAFTDSAPVLEKALARNAGLGWVGKHTLILDRDAGSWFFLGELYVDLPLPVDQPATAHCGRCAGCLDVCPTGALFRSEFGTVVVQADVCNGCGTCVAGCPFGVIERRKDGLVEPKTNRDFTAGEQAPTPHVGVAQKCTLCYDRLVDGLEPACAKTCPTTSIKFGDHADLTEQARERVRQLHAQGLTEARLYGANPNSGVGGTGSVFLLLDEPEVYGLPPDPRVPTADLPHMFDRASLAAVGMIAGVVLAFFTGRRRR